MSRSDSTRDAVAILDFGSQYSQLIARRVREAHVYCELFHPDSSAEEVLALRPSGFILSGGPRSVYDSDAPGLPAYVLESGLPVLGICYGMQLLATSLGGGWPGLSNASMARLCCRSQTLTVGSLPDCPLPFLCG